MSLKITNATMARAESSFRQLATAAQALNTAADELGRVVRHLDAALKKLGLGVDAWVPVIGLSDEMQYWTIELGYTKIESKWGLALREVTGSHLDHNDDSERVWPYNEAPRKHRAEAVEKIPDLLEKLLQETQETTRTLKEKIDQASDFNSVLTELTPMKSVSQPQQWQRPEVSAVPAAKPARQGPQDGSESRPAAPQGRELQPLPMDRASAQKPAAAGTPAQPIARAWEEEQRVATSAAPGTRPAPAARVL